MFGLSLLKYLWYRYKLCGVRSGQQIEPLGNTPNSMAYIKSDSFFRHSLYFCPLRRNYSVEWELNASKMIAVYQSFQWNNKTIILVGSNCLFGSNCSLPIFRGFICRPISKTPSNYSLPIIYYQRCFVERCLCHVCECTYPVA